MDDPDYSLISRRRGDCLLETRRSGLQPGRTVLGINGL
jgi:hypothetical protein